MLDFKSHSQFFSQIVSRFKDIIKLQYFKIMVWQHFFCDLCLIYIIPLFNIPYCDMGLVVTSLMERLGETLGEGLTAGCIQHAAAIINYVSSQEGLSA